MRFPMQGYARSNELPLQPHFEDDGRTRAHVAGGTGNNAENLDCQLGILAEGLGDDRWL